MSDQSENEKHLKKKDELASKLNPSRKNNDQCCSVPSSSKASSSKESKKNSQQAEIPEKIVLSRNQTELICIQRKRKEKREIKKQKNFIKLPTEPVVTDSTEVHENVGDDLTKKKEVHILCECEPNVSGAAVPTVISFVNNPCENKDTTTSTDGASTANRTSKSITTRNRNLPEKGNSTKTNATSKFDRCNKETIKHRPLSANTVDKKNIRNKKTNNLQDVSEPTNAAVEKLNRDDKMQGRKPSLIPKLSKTVNCSRKIPENSSNQTQTLSSANKKLNEKQNERLHVNEKLKGVIMHVPKKLQMLVKSPKKVEADETKSISCRMTGLQERLKATTSMLRQKIEMDKSKDQLSEENSTRNLLEETELNIDTKSNVTVDDLYKNIFQLKNTVSSLSESGTFSGQRKYIEKLFINISEIKNIANKLCEYENNPDKTKFSDQDILEAINSDNFFLENEKPQKSLINSKDNKIHIKFVNHEGKKRKIETFYTEAVQTELSLGPKLTSESIGSKTNITSKIREADSLDGVFIPTYEPPVNIEEEEESNGLDITITFPEIAQLNFNEVESHLPVCLSDISAEALKKLKRCPKDFKLLMNFVEGKVSFQSGTGPTNNFSIGPNLKFIESSIDEKKSDVINIKPSTECLYSSQMIPVENSGKLKNSTKSLKATDSELFNVVNLPFLYRSPYSDQLTGHKSCITFRDGKLLSMAVLARQFFKSMPQIPSLTNIFEDEIMESFSKTAFQTQERKRKNRQDQKKRINSNTLL